MGASFALGGLTACRRPVEHILPFSKGVENFIHGKPLYYNTVMSLGGAAMGLTVEDERGPSHQDRGQSRTIRGASEQLAAIIRLRFFRFMTLTAPLPVRARGQRIRTGMRSASLRSESARFSSATARGLRFLSEPINSPSLRRGQEARANALSGRQMGGVQPGSDECDGQPVIAADRFRQSGGRGCARQRFPRAWIARPSCR